MLDREEELQFPEMMFAFGSAEDYDRPTLRRRSTLSALRDFFAKYLKETAAGSTPLAKNGEVQATVTKQEQQAEMDGHSKPPAKKEVEILEDRRRELKKARAAWVAVKTKAEEDLEKVKEGAHREYMADPDQYPKVVQGCKSIDDILDNLDDDLRDTLDQYVSTPLKNQPKLVGLAAEASEILDRYLSFIASNSLMKAIDIKEFADVTIHAPLMKALKDLKKALA